MYTEWIDITLLGGIPHFQKRATCNNTWCMLKPLPFETATKIVVGSNSESGMIWSWSPESEMNYRLGRKLWSTSTSQPTHQQTNHSLTSQPTTITSAEIVQNRRYRSNFSMCSGPFQDSCTQYRAKLVEVLDKWTWTWIGWHSHKRCFHVAVLVKHACFKNMTQMGRRFLFFLF